MSLDLHAAGHSAIGGRSENQDRWLVDPDHRVFAVADGVGGLPGGGHAAEAAIDAIAQFARCYPPANPAAWRGEVLALNHQLVRLGRRIAPGMATTLTVLALEGSQWQAAHVGDSFLFLLRAGKLEALTEEHTMAAEFARRQRQGERLGPLHPFAEHTLTHSLGQIGLERVDTPAGDIRPGDRFLLCTDGVGKVLAPVRLARALAEAATPAKAVKTLVEESLQAGGTDNATAVAIFVSHG
jgi:serine/threonine protein phosphatase PrpC